MRFAFTAAQSNCTWAELAELWDVADELDVFTTGWVYDHFYPCAPVPRSRRWRAGPVWRCCSPGQQTPRRRDGDRHPVPPPGGAGEHGGHGRHRVERAAGARRRCRLVRARVRGLRDRTGLDHRALRPPGGGVDRHPVAAHRADDDLRRALLPTARRVVRAEVGAATAPADRARRQGRATAAPAGGALRRPLELLRRRSGGVPPAARSLGRAVRGRGPADRGPDASANVRPPTDDLARIADTIAAYGEAGAT